MPATPDLHYRKRWGFFSAHPASPLRQSGSRVIEGLHVQSAPRTSHRSMVTQNVMDRLRVKRRMPGLTRKPVSHTPFGQLTRCATPSGVAAIAETVC